MSADAAAVRALRLQALQSSPDLFGARAADLAAWPLARWQEELEDSPTVAIFVGESAGELVAMGSVKLTADDWRGDAELVSLWVLAGHRRRGFARAITIAREHWAAEQPGVATVHVDCNARNEAVIALMRSLGYRRLRLRPWPGRPGAELLTLRKTLVGLDLAPAGPGSAAVVGVEGH